MTQFFDMFLHDAHVFIMTVTIAPLIVGYVIFLLCETHK